MLQHGNPHAIPWGAPSSGAATNSTTSPGLHAMRQHYAQPQQQQPPLQPPPPLGAADLVPASSATSSADEHHRRISEVQACAEAARAMIGFCLRTFKDHKHGKAPMDLVNLQSLLGAADAGMGELHEKIQTLYTLVPRGGAPPQASSQTQQQPQDLSLDDIKAQVANEAAQLAATAAMIRSERSGRPAAAAAAAAAGPSSSTSDLAAAAAASLYNPASKAAAPATDENRYVDTNVHHTQHQAPAPAHKQTWAETAAPRLQQQQQQQGALSPAEPLLQPSAPAAAAPAPAPFEEPNPDEDVFHSMIGRLERQYQTVKGAGDQQPQPQPQPQPHQQPSRPHYALSPNTSGVSSAGAAAAAADSSFDSSFARPSPADEPHPQPAWHAALQHQQHYPQQQQQPYMPPSVPVNPPSSSQVSHSAAASASGESVTDWMAGGVPHTPVKPLATTPSRMVTTPPEALATPPSRGGPYGAVASYAGSGAPRGRAQQEVTPQQHTPTPSRPRRQGMSPSPGRHNNTGGKQQQQQQPTSQTRTSSAGMHWKSSGERDGPKTFVLRFDDDAGTDCDDARPAGGGGGGGGVGVGARGGRGGEHQQHHQRGRSAHMSNTASSSSRVVSPNSRPSPSHRRPSPAKKGWR